MSRSRFAKKLSRLGSAGPGSHSKVPARGAGASSAPTAPAAEDDGKRSPQGPAQGLLAGALAAPSKDAPPRGRTRTKTPGPAPGGLLAGAFAAQTTPQDAPPGTRSPFSARPTAPHAGESKPSGQTAATPPGSASDANVSAVPQPSDEPQRTGFGGGFLGQAFRNSLAPQRERYVREVEEQQPLPGKVERLSKGEVHRVVQWLEPAHCHGKIPVASALDAPSELVAQLALDPSLADIDFRKMLFVDTETTGLSTGAGTIPFLVGVAFFEDESLCVEQLLVTAPGNEAPLLHHLAERIEEASCVVSYNGKSFDWPLLRTRFVMNRVPTPQLPPHLDLLHCSRRVFKGRMASVRLVNMEEEVLGFYREDDVGGAEIPAVYRRFLRTGLPGKLPGVIEHNANDLIALASLLGELSRRFEKVREEGDPRDHLAYAKVAERAGNGSKAKAFAWACAEGGAEGLDAQTALLLAARIARRGKDPIEEERALRKALLECPGPKVHLELAKFYEHRKKDLGRALHHAQLTQPEETEAEQAKRIARLERRQAKAHASSDGA